MDGATFFFALGLSGLHCLGAWLGFHVAVGVRVCSTVPMLLARACSGSITLTAWAASSSRGGSSGDFFSLSPFPSRRLFFACVSQSIPRPRAWDVRTGGRSAAAGGMPICLLLIVSCRSLACARSLLSRLRFGFSSRASFFSCLPSRVSFACVGTRPRFAPCPPSRAFPASSRRRRFSVSCPCVSSSLLGSSRASFSLASSFPVPIVGLLASPVSLSWRSCPRVGFTTFRLSPRLAYRMAGR